MNNYIRTAGVLAVALSVANAYAYTFTFRNHLKVPVTVSLHLVAKSDYDTKVIPAAKIDGIPGEGSFDFGGWYIGFCLDVNTVKLAKEGDALIEQPVLFTSQNTRDQIVREMKESGRTSHALGTPRRKLSSICRSQDFDIVVDRDGKVCIIMVHESY